ncbi:MAG: hypothetical protein RIT22_603 [Bacteroidota bacterium]
MKKIYFFSVFILSFVFFSCEEVIPLNLETTPPKLVIEASIVWKKGTTGSAQKIKLSTTTSFYSDTPIKVLGATVFIKNSANTTFTFTEVPNTGEYRCSNFVPVIGENYTLTIISNGNTYTANETLQSVASISNVEQNNQAGFSGKDIELKAHYFDPVNTPNYYLYRYTYSSQVTSNYYTDEDLFFNGNEFFSISQNDKIKSGDKVEINHYGISKTYFNYMSVLVSIAGNGGGGPFQSPPATVRGNIFNTTQPENFPLGYFSLSEYDSVNYIVK